MLLGLTVYVLGPTVSQADCAETLQELLQRLAKAKEEMASMRDHQDQPDEKAVSKKYIESLSETEDAIKTDCRFAVVPTDVVFSCIRAVNSVQDYCGWLNGKKLEAFTHSKNLISDILDPYNIIQKDKLWRTIASKCLLGQTTTNVRGEYSLTFAKGKYVIYAYYQDNFNVIEWAIPVDISKPGNIELNLFNNNAHIVNKDSN